MSPIPDSPTATAVWAASPLAILGDAGCLAPTGRLGNRTVRNTVRVTGTGSRLRVRVSNRFGDRTLVLGTASVGLAGQGAAIEGKPSNLCFGGRRLVEVAPGEEAVSDWMDLGLRAGDRVAVSLFVQGPGLLATFHKQATQDNWLSEPGDHALAPSGAPFTEQITSWLFLSGVDVEAPHNRLRSLVAFGDSITDGTGSTHNADRRWPDQFADRMLRKDRPCPSVVNAGVAGNCLLSDGGNFGDAGVRRFARDALGQPGVGAVIVLTGVNDIGFGAPGGTGVVHADQLIAGLRQLIAAARRAGVPILGGTLLPFKGVKLPGFWTQHGEAVRQAVNAWVIDGGEFDAVVDFAGATAAAHDPELLDPALDSGDGIHPNDLGYRAMAHAVNILTLDRLLRDRTPRRPTNGRHTPASPTAGHSR